MMRYALVPIVFSASATITGFAIDKNLYVYSASLVVACLSGGMTGVMAAKAELFDQSRTGRKGSTDG